MHMLAAKSLHNIASHCCLVLYNLCVMCCKYVQPNGLLVCNISNNGHNVQIVAGYHVACGHFCGYFKLT